MSRNPQNPIRGIKHRLGSLSAEQRALLEQRLEQPRSGATREIAETLRANGVTHIYSLCGGPIQKTLAMAARSGIRVIGVHHQQAAVMMALAQNYTAGKACAAVMLSAGPAVTNAATGLLVAKDNGWPVVVLAGRTTPSVHVHGQFQELDGADLYKPITKWSTCINRTTDLSATLDKAFDVATAGRPGAVYVDITEDVLTGNLDNEVSRKAARPVKQGSQPAPEKIQQVATLLRNAHRPAIIAGKGLRWHTDPELLCQLIERQQIAFISSPMGRGIIPDTHELCFNHARVKVQSGADVILVLGARLNWTFRYGGLTGPETQLIHVDIDPDEVKANSKVTCGVVADAGCFLTALLDELPAPPEEDTLVQRHDWHRLLDEESSKRTGFLNRLAATPALPMSPFRLMQELEKAIPEDSIVVVDGKTSMMAAQLMITARKPFSRITVGSNGCIGTGIPFGIGAAIQNPQRPVVVISSDTGFGMNGMEIETAVRNRVPIVLIVVNNNGISGEVTQKSFFPDEAGPIATFEPGISYEKIATAVGAEGILINSPEQVQSAVKRAISSGKPFCINVTVNPNAKYLSEL